MIVLMAVVVIVVIGGLLGWGGRGGVRGYLFFDLMVIISGDVDLDWWAIDSGLMKDR